jgi:hypothetical protein
MNRNSEIADHNYRGWKRELVVLKRFSRWN